MKLSYGLTIEQTQKLTMTPELIQAIRILQFSTQELDSFVQEELLENPVLEIDGKRKDDKTVDIDIQEKIKEDSSNATEQGGIRILLVFLLTFFVNGICSDTDSFFKENLSLTLAHTVTG